MNKKEKPIHPQPNKVKDVDFLATRLKVLNMTYAHMGKNIKLLEQMEFIELQKIGRINKATLTKRGEDFIEVFLGLMR